MDTDTNTNPSDQKTPASSSGSGQFANAVTLIGEIRQEPTFSYSETGLAILSGSLRIQPVYQAHTEDQGDAADVFAVQDSIFKTESYYRNFAAFGDDAVSL